MFSFIRVGNKLKYPLNLSSLKCQSLKVKPIFRGRTFSSSANSSAQPNGQGKILKTFGLFLGASGLVYLLTQTDVSNFISKEDTQSSDDKSKIQTINNPLPNTNEKPLKIIPLSLVKQKRSEKELWVIFNDHVYDMTDFIHKHPGGSEALLSTGGLDVNQFWQFYQIHYRSEKVLLEFNENRLIGKLSDSDILLLHQENEENKNNLSYKAGHGYTPDNTAVVNASKRYFYQSIGVGFLFVVIGPIATITRWTTGFFNFIGLGFINHFIQNLFPFTVVKNGLIKKRKSKKVNKDGPNEINNETIKVAIIGGGISGMGAAFTLANTDSQQIQNGQEGGPKKKFEVTVYESRDKLGGNAQSFNFVNDKGKIVPQDLLVMFFSPVYYKNYMALLEKLNIKPSIATLPYLLRTDYTGKPEYYTPPGSNLDRTGLIPESNESISNRFKNDFHRYEKTVNLVRSVNDYLCNDKNPSFYKQVTFFSLFNPFTYLSMRTVLCNFGGVSKEFFNEVIEPFHSLSMYYNPACGDLPAVTLPILDDISPLSKAKPAATFGLGSSREVFDRLAKPCTVKLNTRVKSVKPLIDSNNPDSTSLLLEDDRGNRTVYDKVIFACPAGAVANILQDKNWVQNTILNSVAYDDDLTRPSSCFSLLEAPIHTDDRVLPSSQFEQNIIKKEAAFLIDVQNNYKNNNTNSNNANNNNKDNSNNRLVSFHHVLGSWPAARAADSHGASWYISFNLHDQAPPPSSINNGNNNDNIDKLSIPDNGLILGRASPPKAHPQLSNRNIILTQLLHLIQGKNNVFYAGSWTAPGNGHDLALTSGLAVASAVGGDYLFTDNKDAHKDFLLMKKFMNV